mmetsp:Transcript_9973/g.20944  ORF Transcript_9973/g.20944 Transcript_9973/m.20944 type:complete len:209 (+) Transcript_9973:144-770(+)
MTAKCAWRFWSCRSTHSSLRRSSTQSTRQDPAARLRRSSGSSWPPRACRSTARRCNARSSTSETATRGPPRSSPKTNLCAACCPCSETRPSAADSKTSTTATDRIDFVKKGVFCVLFSLAVRVARVESGACARCTARCIRTSGNVPRRWARVGRARSTLQSARLRTFPSGTTPTGRTCPTSPTRARGAAPRARAETGQARRVRCRETY